MKKLLYTYERDMPTVSMYREGVLSKAEKRGVQVRFKQILEISKEDIYWCDVVIMLRPNDPYSAHLAQCAQNAGCFVIAYYDDDLYGLPQSHPNPKWRKDSVLKVLARSNMIDSSSRHICEKYRKYTLEKRSRVSDTIVNASDIKLITEDCRDDAPVKLVYAANAGHVGFFNQFIMPVMPRLCQRYAGKISMTFMGVRPELSEFESMIDIRYYNSMPLEDYRRVIRDGNYDIGLSPLTTTEFTKCKYFNKFIEYTMAGIVGVYSNTEPYTYVVQHGINGFLAEDDAESWFHVLCKAIDDTALRRNCIKNAQKLLITEFNAEKLLDKEEKQIPELLSYSSRHGNCGSLKIAKLYYRLIRVLDKVYLAYFYLRNTGVTGFIAKTKMHFRERNAYK